MLPDHCCINMAVERRERRLRGNLIRPESGVVLNTRPVRPQAVDLEPRRLGPLASPPPPEWTVATTVRRPSVAPIRTVPVLSDRTRSTSPTLAATINSPSASADDSRQDRFTERRILLARGRERIAQTVEMHGKRQRLMARSWRNSRRSSVQTNSPVRACRGGWPGFRRPLHKANSIGDRGDAAHGFPSRASRLGSQVLLPFGSSLGS
jgi:hypothetical protein